MMMEIALGANKKKGFYYDRSCFPPRVTPWHVPNRTSPLRLPEALDAAATLETLTTARGGRLEIALETDIGEEIAYLRNASQEEHISRCYLCGVYPRCACREVVWSLELAD